MVEITTEAVGISQWRTKTALGCAVTILTLVLANCVGIQYENLSSRENGSIYDQAQKYSTRMTSGDRGVGFKAEQMEATKAFSKKYPKSCSSFSEGAACSAQALAKSRNLTPNSAFVLVVSFVEFESGGRCNASGQFDPDQVFPNAEKLNEVPPIFSNATATFHGPDYWNSNRDLESEYIHSDRGVIRTTAWFSGVDYASYVAPEDQEIFQTFVDHEEFKEFCLRLKYKAK